MRVHRVIQGETLRDIAKQYGVSVRDIVHVNELSSQNVIVPGLGLLIPTREGFAVQSYVIQQGDTVAQIKQKFGVSDEIFQAWTGLKASQTSLPVGTRIYLPVRSASKRAIEVNGYLTPSGTTSDENILANDSDATYVSVFSYQARANGTLVPPKDSTALVTAKRYQIQPLMTVTNFDGNTFSTSLAHTLLANASLRTKFISQILSTCTSKGYAGVNVDFEHMQPADRPLYNQFILDLRDAAHARKLTVSIAMGPKTADNPNQSWMGAFDYKTLGQEVDYLMLMTYEWGWVGGPPMAIAPVNQVRSVLDYATSVIDPQKILMGLSLYGYDWPLPYVQGKTRASGISNNDAQNLAVTEQSTVNWDVESASPWYEYTSGGIEHRVWYDDPLSAAIKLSLVNEYNLRGVTLWVLGNEFPQLWYLLQDQFTVKKL